MKKKPEGLIKFGNYIYQHIGSKVVYLDMTSIDETIIINYILDYSKKYYLKYTTRIKNLEPEIKDKLKSNMRLYKLRYDSDFNLGNVDRYLNEKYIIEEIFINFDSKWSSI